MEPNLFDMLDDLNPIEDNHISRDQDILRAPFGYPGGKDKSIRELLEHLPIRDSWIDCCGGSGVVTLARPKSKILDVYNDRWSGVTTFFRCLRDDSKYIKLRDNINLTMHSREEFVYAKANWENSKLDDVERATLFYLMISQSFGKLCRNWARALHSKVAFKRSIEIPYWEALHTRFGQCQIENMTVDQCLKDYDDPGAVFYIDYPYLNTDTGIYKEKTTYDTHKNTLDLVFSEVKGYVAFSHYQHSLYAKYAWDDVKVWPVKVSIDSKSSTSSGNRTYSDQEMRTVHECLYIKEASE